MLLLFLLSALALAHPFGTDLYGHRLEVRLDRDTVQVDYLAEISTVDHLRDLRDFLRDVPAPTAADEDRYVTRVLDELETGIDVVVDGQQLDLTRMPVDLPSGKGDTRFTNFRLSLRADLPDDARQLNVVNSNLPGNKAIFSTDLLVTDAIVIDASSLYEVEGERVARNQAGQWLDEERGRELRVSFRTRSEAGAAVQRGFRRLAAGGELEPFQPAASQLDGVHEDPLMDLVRGELTPAAVLLGLLTAVVLGGLHGLSPGHGKALVAAYLVGSRRSLSQAVWLGLVVTITHTISVYALGAVALVLAESFSPEAVMPWLELASGVLVVGVGFGLIRSRWRAARAAAPAAAAGATPAAGGLSGTLKVVGVGHGHAHDHSHDHDHGHAHDHGMDHAAHGAAHAKEIAQAAEGWKSLVALGVSGGLAPCPSALVLLLTAIGLQRIGLGLVLVFAFSVGLALLVSGLGIAVLLLGDRFMQGARSGRAVRVLPVFSAAVVTLLGIALTWKGVLSVVGGMG